MRAKPSSSRAAKSRSNGGKSGGGSSKGGVKKKEVGKTPDFSVLRQPVDTSVSGLKQAVKVFETGTPEVLHLLTYDCEVIYECKICRNLFRSIANFISHKRVYCTARYTSTQDLQRTSKEGEDFNMVVGERVPERLPTRITARQDLTSIVESLSGPRSSSECSGSPPNADKKITTVHLEPMENTTYGVFQTVFNDDASKDLMKNQVAELQNLLSKNEVVLGPDGRVLQNGLSDLSQEKVEPRLGGENGYYCDICNLKCATRKTLLKHKKNHESIKTSYSCPCCKNIYCNPWSVYRHLYKAHRKTNEQVRKLRPQIHKKVVHRTINKPIPNTSNGKKGNSPEKRNSESDVRQRLHQNNMEWMNHLEDDGEFQRCGGCGRKFERKAALLAHAQICQKRIDACNSNDQIYQAIGRVNLSPVVALKAMTCSKKPVPKRSPEKKIGIQVRMNYCKGRLTCGSPSQPCNRQRSSSRSVLGDESDLEATSVDGKDSLFQKAVKASANLKVDSVLDHFIKNTKCHSSDSVDKVNLYLNDATNTLDNTQTYTSTCKTSTFSRITTRKNKTLEEKCLQLRSALETKKSHDIIVKQGNELSNVYINGNTDNTSESSGSALSSLSSQLTPVVDKAYMCEVEQSIEIKNINVIEDEFDLVENPHKTDGGDGLLMKCNSETVEENYRILQGKANQDEKCPLNSNEILPTSADHDFTVESNSNCLNDDEISVDMKPVLPVKEEPTCDTQGIELENTISILTRNQLKAICKDDILPPKNDDKKKEVLNGLKKNSTDAEVEAATREFTRRKLAKYVNETDKSCNICERKFKKVVDIYKHIRIHTRWKRYKCLFDGCRFTAFLKSTCMHHVVLHVKDCKGTSADSLVGLIDPSKWNVRLNELDRKHILKDKGSSDKSVVVRNGSPLKEIKKIVTLKKLKKIKKSQLKTIDSAGKESNKNISLTSPTGKNKTLLTLSNANQKLLTDFKNVKKSVKVNDSVSPASRKVEKRILKIARRSIAESKQLPVKQETNKLGKEDSKQVANLKIDVKLESNKPEQEDSKQVDNLKAVKPAEKRKRLISTSSPVQPKKKNSTAQIEPLQNEILVNHILADGSEVKEKKRGSRSSSRKSSISNGEQQKAKNSVNSVNIMEDTTVTSVSTVVCEPITSIQNVEVFGESSSLEEEESQEEGENVDDSHLKKIFMEVIFGPPASEVTVQSAPTGRPVRNKTRPKRDSDFILGGQREIEKELEAKSSNGKKPVCMLQDTKPVSEAVKKSK